MTETQNGEFPLAKSVFEDLLNFIDNRGGTVSPIKNEPDKYAVNFEGRNFILSASEPTKLADNWTVPHVYMSYPKTEEGFVRSTVDFIEDVRGNHD